VCTSLGATERGHSSRIAEAHEYCRARTDPATRAYLDRKAAEGKTKRAAIRCLKRHLARDIWQILYAAEPAHSAPARAAVKVTAPGVMHCTR